MSIETFPTTRMRRTRMRAFTRDLCRETELLPRHLIYPLFVTEGYGVSDAVSSMPGVYRYSLDSAATVAKQAQDLGIKAVALFPVIEANLKTPDAKEAWNPNGLVPRAVQTLKKACPELGVITDVALDPYTSHGQDGVIDAQGEILNDQTIGALVKQALCHAEAGSDIVAPSDMMDGRIGVIRRTLEEQNHMNTMILAYSAKYASSFYGPFRDALGSKGALGKSSKYSYQMNPANSREAVREIALDIQEGADMVMVKPGLPYLDIIRLASDTFDVPIFAYNVSGEYAMIKAAAQQGWIDEQQAVLEALLSFRRAGAIGILTYHALDAARWLTHG